MLAALARVPRNTRARELLRSGAGVAAAYALLLVLCPHGPARWVLLGLPSYALCAYAGYALIVIGRSVYAIREFPEERRQLDADVAEAMAFFNAHELWPSAPGTQAPVSAVASAPVYQPRKRSAQLKATKR